MPISDESPALRSGRIARLGWLLVGFSALVCGAVGVVLPLLPTTPFVLLAAFAFARSSPTLRRWLVEHRTFGPMIADWELHGAIARRYKVLACGVMLASLIGSFLASVPTYIFFIQLIVMAGAATFVLTRPDVARDP